MAWWWSRKKSVSASTAESSAERVQIEKLKRRYSSWDLDSLRPAVSLAQCWTYVYAHENTITAQALGELYRDGRLPAGYVDLVKKELSHKIRSANLFQETQEFQKLLAIHRENYKAMLTCSDSDYDSAVREIVDSCIANSEWGTVLSAIEVYGVYPERALEVAKVVYDRRINQGDIDAAQRILKVYGSSIASPDDVYQFLIMHFQSLCHLQNRLWPGAPNNFGEHERTRDQVVADVAKFTKLFESSAQSFSKFVALLIGAHVDCLVIVEAVQAQSSLEISAAYLLKLALMHCQALARSLQEDVWQRQLILAEFERTLAKYEVKESFAKWYLEQPDELDALLLYRITK